MDLLDKTAFDAGFLFKYSERSKTYAARHLSDDVPETVKTRRLSQLLKIFRERQLERTLAEVGKIHLVRIATMTQN